MKRITVYLLLVLTGCAKFQTQAEPGVIHVSGRIEGDAVDLGFKSGGRIAEILVREGDPVQPGQLLARLLSDQEEIRMREAEARLSGARARLDQARLQLPTLEQRLAVSRLAQQQAGEDAPPRVKLAQAQLAVTQAELRRVLADEGQAQLEADRYKGLAEKGAAPRQIAEQSASRLAAAHAAVDALRRQVMAAESGIAVARAALQSPRIREAEGKTIERQMEEARASIRLAESEVRVAQSGVDRAQQDLRETELHAPTAGTVITRAAEPGRNVAGGATVLTLVDLKRLYMRGFVPEGQIGRVKLAQRAQVYLDSAPDKPLEAEVTRVDPQAMFTPENTYFKEDRVKQVVGIKLGLKGGEGAAKPGMPADGKIHVQ